MGAFREFPENDRSQVGAEDGALGGSRYHNTPLSYEDYGVDGGGIRFDGRGGGGGGAGANEATFSSSTIGESAFHCSAEAADGGTGRVDVDHGRFGGLPESASASADAAASGHSLLIESGSGAGEAGTMPGLRGGSGVNPDNWGILKYGLTLENPVAGQGSSLDVSPGREHHRQRSGEDADGSQRAGQGRDRGGGNGGGGSDGTRGSGRIGGDGSSPSSTVAMMMDSLSMRDDSPQRNQRRAAYAGQPEPREDPATSSAALMFGGGGSDRESGDVVFSDGGAASSGQLHSASHADEAGGDLGGDGGGASFGFLDSRTPKFEPRNDDHALLRQEQHLQQQQAQQQQLLLPNRKQSVPPPLHPRRTVGGSPSLGSQQSRRHLPPRGNLDTGAFAPPVGGGADNIHGASDGGGGGGGGGSPGRFRWSFPPPGMSGGEVADGTGGPMQQGSVTRLDQLATTDGHAVVVGTGGDSSFSGEGVGRLDGRGGGSGAPQWSVPGTAGPTSSGYGMARRLVFDEDAGRGGLSGSVDSHQYARMRGQQRGYQVGV